MRRDLEVLSSTRLWYIETTIQSPSKRSSNSHIFRKIPLILSLSWRLLNLREASEIKVTKFSSTRLGKYAKRKTLIKLSSLAMLLQTNMNKWWSIEKNSTGSKNGKLYILFFHLFRAIPKSWGRRRFLSTHSIYWGISPSLNMLTGTNQSSNTSRLWVWSRMGNANSFRYKRRKSPKTIWPTLFLVRFCNLLVVSN